MFRWAIFQAGLVVLVSGFAWSQPVEPRADVARITSDTVAYCVQLAERAESAPMPGDAKALHDQGVVLCARGQVQAGIARLRRALLITRSDKVP